jgi:hypothetical protein
VEPLPDTPSLKTIVEDPALNVRFVVVVVSQCGSAPVAEIYQFPEPIVMERAPVPLEEKETALKLKLLALYAPEVSVNLPLNPLVRLPL